HGPRHAVGVLRQAMARAARAAPPRRGDEAPRRRPRRGRARRARRGRDRPAAAGPRPGRSDGMNTAVIATSRAPTDPARLRPILWAAAACLAWLGLLRTAGAQPAPAGNAHPDTHMVSEPGPIENPFGMPNLDPDARATPEAKHAFARAVDLEPLRDLAVFHNGRVKILDTLGREVV